MVAPARISSRHGTQAGFGSFPDSCVCEGPIAVSDEPALLNRANAQRDRAQEIRHLTRLLLVHEDRAWTLRQAQALERGAARLEAQAMQFAKSERPAQQLR